MGDLHLHLPLSLGHYVSELNRTMAPIKPERKHSHSTSLSWSEHIPIFPYQKNQSLREQKPIYQHFLTPRFGRILLAYDATYSHVSHCKRFPSTFCYLGKNPHVTWKDFLEFALGQSNRGVHVERTIKLNYAFHNMIHKSTGSLFVLKLRNMFMRRLSKNLKDLDLIS